jgi:heme exporter protein D
LRVPRRAERGVSGTPEHRSGRATSRASIAITFSDAVGRSDNPSPALASRPIRPKSRVPASKLVFQRSRSWYGRVMLVWIALALCVVALVILFMSQLVRSRENAEETAQLREAGLRWNDWFEQ